MYKCPFCGKQVKRIVNLKTHITRVHFKYGYYCPYCKKEFSSLQSLQIHLSLKNDELHKNLLFLITKGYAHEINKELFFVNDDEENQNFSFKCPYCGKQIKTIVNLKIHILKSHYKRTIYCPYCKREFKSLYALLRHLRFKNDIFHKNLFNLLCKKRIKFVKKELFRINKTESELG